MKFKIFTTPHGNYYAKVKILFWWEKVRDWRHNGSPGRYFINIHYERNLEDMEKYLLKEFSPKKQVSREKDKLIKEMEL